MLVGEVFYRFLWILCCLINKIVSIELLVTVDFRFIEPKLIVTLCFFKLIIENSFIELWLTSFDSVSEWTCAGHFYTLSCSLIHVQLL